MLPGTLLVTVSGLRSIATPEKADTEQKAAHRPTAIAAILLARLGAGRGAEVAGLFMAVLPARSRGWVVAFITWPPRWPAAPPPRVRCCSRGRGCGRRSGTWLPGPRRRHRRRTARIRRWSRGPVRHGCRAGPGTGRSTGGAGGVVARAELVGRVEPAVAGQVGADRAAAEGAGRHASALGVVDVGQAAARGVVAALDADDPAVAVGEHGGADLVLGLAQRRLGLLEGEAAVVHVGAHPLLQQRAAEHGQAQQGHDQQQDEDDDEGCALLAPGE